MSLKNLYDKNMKVMKIYLIKGIIYFSSFCYLTILSRVAPINFVADKFRYKEQLSNELNLPSNADDCGCESDVSICSVRPPAHNFSFSMQTYFENLYAFAPQNSVGSCGYVSLISIMSYYDTFYNDNIIPDAFDFHNYLNSNFDEAISNSPGTKNEQYVLHEDTDAYAISCNEHETYFEFCQRTKNNNLQSKLSLLNKSLLEPQDAMYWWHTFGIEREVSKPLLDAFYEEEDKCFVTTYFGPQQQNALGLSNEDLTEIIKNEIDHNRPVFVGIYKFNESTNVSYDHHAVVAYDYDEDNVYANFGYGESFTHMPLLGGSMNYNYIGIIGLLDFSRFGHSHSDNYVIGRYTYCGCGERSGSLPPNFEYWDFNTSDPGIFHP